jgi:hypothetical protein
MRAAAPCHHDKRVDPFTDCADEHLARGHGE